MERVKVRIAINCDDYSKIIETNYFLSVKILISFLNIYIRNFLHFLLPLLILKLLNIERKFINKYIKLLNKEYLFSPS